MSDTDNNFDEMSPYFVNNNNNNTLEQSESVDDFSPSSKYFDTPLKDILVENNIMKKDNSSGSCSRTELLPQLLPILPKVNEVKDDEVISVSQRSKEEIVVDPWDDEDDDGDLRFVTDTYGRDYLVIQDGSEDSSGRSLYLDLTTGDVKTNLFLPSPSKRKRKRWMKDVPEGVLKKFFLERKDNINNGGGDGERILVKKPESSLVDQMSMSLGQEVIKSIKSSWEGSSSSLARNVKWSGDEYSKINNISKSPFKNTSTAFYEGLKLNKIRTSSSSSSVKFEKDDLAKMQVMFQVDKKFILGKCSRNGRDLVVLFDQHAVHERIRLERLILEAYENFQIKKFKSFPIAPPIQLSFTETEVMMLQSYPETFELIGAKLQIASPTCVKVHSAPLAFFEKVSSEVIANKEATMKNLLASLLQDQVRQILDTKVTNVNSVPRTIFNILASQACRGAVKFGQELNLQQCELLISRLKNCKTPFQCAHGRPSLVPLVDLKAIRARTDILHRKCEPAHFDPHLSQNSSNKYNETSHYFNESSGYFEDDEYDEIFKLL